MSATETRLLNDDSIRAAMDRAYPQRFDNGDFLSLLREARRRGLQGPAWWGWPA